MTKTSQQSSPRRSRRWTSQTGFPQLAAALPPNFECAGAVNGFIYSLTAEVTAGRVDSRTAAVLGYLSQLAIQTLPLLRAESEPPDDGKILYEFTYAPRADSSKVTDSTPDVTALSETNSSVACAESRK